jgi:hypothetical protein
VEMQRVARCGNRSHGQLSRTDGVEANDHANDGRGGPAWDLSCLVDGVYWALLA